MQYLMQARDSVTGEMHRWLSAGGPDFAGSGYTGPNAPEETAVVASPGDTTGSTGGWVAADTYTEVRHLSRTGYALLVRGRATVGDGGRGLFLWDASATVADDGATVLRPASVSPEAPGRWRRVWEGGVDPLWWGTDRSAIESALAAYPVVDLSSDWDLSTDYAEFRLLQVPAGALLRGNGHVVTGPGLLIEGDDVTVEGLSLRCPTRDGASPGALPSVVRALDRSGLTLRGLGLDTAFVDIRNTGTSPLRGLLIEGCEISGDFSAWTHVVGVNCITVAGVSDCVVANNRLIDIVGPHRFVKIQASTAYEESPTGDAYSSRVVFTGNVLEGVMASGKQVIDLFHGTGEAIVDQNVIKITGDVGGSTVIEQKTGDGGHERSAKGRQISISGNVIDTDLPDAIFVSGAYSLDWEGEEQAVKISGNILRHRNASNDGRYLLHVRGMHTVQVSDNQVVNPESTADVLHAVYVGNCRDVVVQGNAIDKGSIVFVGGVHTTGGDPYTGVTEAIVCTGNVVRDARHARGAVVCDGMMGAPDVVITNNTLHSSQGSSIAGCVSLDDTFGSVVVMNNTGATGDVSTTRMHKGGNLAATRLLEECNSWNSGGFRVGDGSGAAEMSLLAGAGSEPAMRWVQGGALRARGWIAGNGAAWALSAYDTSGVTIDSPVAVTLQSGGNILLGGSGRTIVCNGQLRPSTDNQRDIGTQAHRWATIYSQGGFHTGIRTVTSNTSLTTSDSHVLVDASNGSVTIGLQDGSESDVRNGKVVRVTRIDSSANVVTVQRAGSVDQILNGTAAVDELSLSPGETTLLHYQFSSKRWVRSIERTESVLEDLSEVANSDSNAVAITMADNTVIRGRASVVARTEAGVAHTCMREFVAWADEGAITVEEDVEVGTDSIDVLLAISGNGPDLEFTTSNGSGSAVNAHTRIVYSVQRLPNPPTP